MLYGVTLNVAHDRADALFSLLTQTINQWEVDTGASVSMYGHAVQS